eukprot:25973-Pelagococcus_subviridis.AAC.2
MGVARRGGRGGRGARLLERRRAARGRARVGRARLWTTAPRDDRFSALVVGAAPHAGTGLDLVSTTDRHLTAVGIPAGRSPIILEARVASRPYRARIARGTSRATPSRL